MHPITAWDLSVLDAIAAHLHCGLGDTVFPIVTSLANLGMIWIALALILLASPRTRRAGLILILALILELFFCNAVFKPLLHRVRPFTLHDYTLLIPAPTDGSFPSGHAGASFAAAAALFGCKSRLRWPSLLLAALIAFSRLYLLLHYPSDVLGGMALGIACGWAAVRIGSFFLQRDALRQYLRIEE